MVSIYKNNTALHSLQLKTTSCLTQCVTKMWGSTWGHEPEVSSLQKKKKLCQGSKSTCGVSCFFASLFCFILSLLPLEPGLDMTALQDCCCGQTVLCFRGSLPIQTEVKRPIKVLFLPQNFMSVPDTVLFEHCIWWFCTG